MSSAAFAPGRGQRPPKLGVKKPNRCVDRTERKQRRVDDTLTSEDHDPCKSAYDDTCQEWQEHNENDERLRPRSDAVIEPCDWKTQHKAQGRHFRAQQQRRAEDAQTEWIGEEMNVLAETPKGTGRIVV